MKISVVLATYNGRPFLPEQLDSLARQTRLPDELLICDDGSTDGTVSYLQDFARRAPFETRIHENKNNLGYTQNFAQAVEMAGGDLIFLCDQDDRWHPEKIAAYLKRFEAEPALQALFSDSALVDENLKSLDATLFATNRFTETEKTWLKSGDAWRTFLRHNVVAGNTLAFRASNRALLLPIPAGWVHDAWFSTIFALSGGIDFIDSCYIDYRQHGRQNIGVLAGGIFSRLRARWKRAIQGERADLAKAAQAWRELRFPPSCPAEAKEKVARKIRWLEGRGQLPKTKLARLPFLLMNAPAYFEFDNGWQTMLKDLFIS